MKKIIVPVDFSDHSEKALQTAASIAKKHNSEILVVHMLELSNAVITQSQSYAQEETAFYLKIAEKKFKDFLNKDYLQGLKVTPIVKHYKIFSELNELARDENATLIVMGSHGVSGLKEIFVGSNTEKVVRNSSVPVLVTKGKSVVTDFSKALFGCDFSDDDIAPYQKAKEFLGKLNCKLHLLHVNTPYGKFRSSKEMREKVAKFLAKANETDITFNDVVYASDYTVEKGILEYAHQQSIDLIVMATHGRKGLSHFFEGSISEDLVNHSNIPVLTIKI
ncbi:universal stress protein [Tenacibaculum sp. IB213877]|uniref:universal stress protein n=1 Tax=Tenacibaculum sp. IB213877 TaxID=3097351 RepID=UPI002A59AACB|nr:universal stress protein [Tenacibaculum sp. IB213877]MDY0781402.1 universal stress protein [Tenacibaculum sp. IB213877]